MRRTAETVGRAAAGAAVGAHLACVAFRVGVAAVGRRAPAAAIPRAPARMPVYTVLGAMRREAPRIAPWVAAMEALDYPRERLDVVLLLEADDPATRHAVAQELGERGGRPPWLRILTVPAGGPATKPNALNHGLAHARGDLLVVYDAEDVPDPGQLSAAAATFAAAPPDVACLQAELTIDAADGALGRLMAADYRLWHGGFLRGLARLGAPVPLAGTSNHLRVAALRRLGGWDARNVTEDAELGMRLARAGLRTRPLASTTRETSTPPGLAAWVRQRSRWSKGFAVTWWQLARAPSTPALRRRDRAAAHLTLAGTLVIQATSPLTLGVVLHALGRPRRLRRPLAAAAAAALGLRLAGLRMTRGGGPAPGALSMVAPFAWALEGIAAMRGLVQLARAPALWEKTDHPPRPR